MNRLVLERLTENKMNKQWTKSFCNTRNKSLQYYIRNKAWEEDSRNETVVYLLKDDNTIAYYFTLKCGLLLKNGSRKKHESFEKPELINHQFYVNATMPAVEIAQFCLNEKWLEQHKIAKGCGKIIFYQHILPLISRLSRYAGCKYIYLYAADATEDETLVKYYEDLGFEKVSDIEYCHIFPEYDIRCILMFASLSSYLYHS